MDGADKTPPAAVSTMPHYTDPRVIKISDDPCSPLPECPKKCWVDTVFDADPLMIGTTLDNGVCGPPKQDGWVSPRTPPRGLYKWVCDSCGRIMYYRSPKKGFHVKSVLIETTKA